MFRRTFLALLPAGLVAPLAARAGSHAAPVDVTIRGFAFEPAVIEVTRGHAVRWTNTDGAPHTATADDGSFDTGRLRRNASAEVKFQTPGTYSYFCKFHRTMKGTVVVT